MASATAPQPLPDSAPAFSADEDWRHAGFGVYVHWPFCAAKCPYCDFNSHVTRELDHAAWRRTYLAELQHIAARVSGRCVDTVFFGGGTPSLMEPETVGAVLDAIGRHWTVAADAEITLEANPGSVEAGRFAGYRAAGVNRVSLGVQALNDADLRALGRLHSVADALQAIDIAHDCFDRVSFDLIYARQRQGLADWRAELARALAMGPDHLSLYQLTIEPGTRFGALHAVGKLRDLPDDELAADLWAETAAQCEAAGLPAYEISNHARPGAESRHNLIYWRGGDYAGVGPGAHGRLTVDGQRMATETHLAPSAWLAAVAREGSGQSLARVLDAEERGLEYLLMGLRLRDGVSLRRLAALAPAVIDPAAMEKLTAEGFLLRDGDRLAATERGRPVLNALLRELLA